MEFSPQGNALLEPWEVIKGGKSYGEVRIFW